MDLNIEQKMEQEPAYRLGTAIHLIQCFLGKDSLSLQDPHSKQFVERHVRNWAEEFLAEERKISEEIQKL